MVSEQKDTSEYIYDPKEKVVSVDMEPFVKLDPSAEADKVDLQWLSRTAARKSVALVAAVEGEFSRELAHGGRGG